MRECGRATAGAVAGALACGREAAHSVPVSAQLNLTLTHSPSHLQRACTLNTRLRSSWRAMRSQVTSRRDELTVAARLLTSSRPPPCCLVVRCRNTAFVVHPLKRCLLTCLTGGAASSALAAGIRARDIAAASQLLLLHSQLEPLRHTCQQQSRINPKHMHRGERTTAEAAEHDEKSRGKMNEEEGRKVRHGGSKIFSFSHHN